MSLVVLLCRLLLVLLIYHSALLVSPSRRGASLVVAFYAVSPEFYSFNSGFSYQTLALTLGLGGIFLLRRAQLADYAVARRLSLIASLVLIACAVTHHATSWMVLAFLIAWAAMSRKGERKLLARAAVVMGVAVAICTAALTPLLAAYYLPIASAVVQTTVAFLRGTSGHHVFGGYAGTPPPPDWERVTLVIYILACTFAALVCAWIMLRQAFRNRDGMLGLLGALDLAFLVTSASHFYPSVGELGNRASTFLFLPLALSCSLIIQRHPRVTRRPAQTRDPLRTAVLIPLIGGTTIIYLGGVLLGPTPIGIVSQVLTSCRPTFAHRILKLWRRLTGLLRIFLRAVPWQPTVFRPFSSRAKHGCGPRLPPSKASCRRNCTSQRPGALRRPQSSRT